MHDLRRQALESGKTVSRKAQSRLSATSPGSSKASSRANSRNNSRGPSRAGSDDEEGGNFSDDTSYSINSIDELLAAEDINETASSHQKEALQNDIEAITDRKGSSVQGREDTYTAFSRRLTAHYHADVLHGRIPDLLAALGKSIKNETSEKETILALKALSLVIVTTTDETIYENIASLLKRTISDSQSLPTKAAAIYTLGTCTFFGGADDVEILDVMNFFIEIISSDGGSIEAHDDADVVIAACEEFGLLATELEDVEAESEDFIEALAEQFDASDPNVQIAAGEDIALLYEKSYSPQEEDESDVEEDENEDHGESSSDEEANGVKLIKRYDPYHNTHEIMTKASALANLSGHKVSRKSKKDIHQSFASIATTIENPRLGPHFNKATGDHFSGRSTVRIHRESEMRVDRWWKLFRLKALRRVLQGGFVNHYFEGNRAVLDTLPMVLRETKESDTGRNRKKAKASGAKRSRAGMRGFDME